MTVKDLTILGCSSQQPTRYRNHGAYLIRWNEEGLLFDPGEGTQRQFIFANIAPPVVTRIFISHFHGDHCLGLGSMLMRLNLDRVQHPIHCYYPASGKKYFDRLRYGTIYHETIKVVEHPIDKEGIVEDNLDGFQIEARFLEHGVDNIGWRITEPDRLRFHKDKLTKAGIRGPNVRKLQEQGSINIEGNEISLEEVSWVQKGESIAVAVDSRLCPNLYKLAHDTTLFLCESTYLNEHKDLAHKNYHLTATQAAEIAKQVGVNKLVLTHFSARYLHLDAFAQEAQAIFPNTEVAEDLKQIPFPKP